MAESKTIRVTPNVQKSLKELKAAVKSMPEGDKKEKAEGALNYLSNTFKGKAQPGRGLRCPTSKPIIIP